MLQGLPCSVQCVREAGRSTNLHAGTDFIRDRAYRLFALIFPCSKPREANLDGAMLTFEKHNCNAP